MNWLHRRSFDVVCAGLDLDILGYPFDTTARLMAIANSIEKLAATCVHCALPASRTGLRGGTAIVSRIRVGGSELYEPLCYSSWLQNDLLNGYVRNR